METTRRLSDKLMLVLKGIAMGTANKVPGVSGGIVAFVVGFYEEFIYSLGRINRKAFGLLFKRGWKPFFQYTNMRFLALLVLGMIISFFTVSKFLDFFLVRKETYVWALFFGMIVGSIYYIAIDFKQWNKRTVILTIIGTFIGFFINFVKPAGGNENMIFIFFCGFISVSGMTLPGLSGSFLLMLIGNYTLLLVDSVNALYGAGVSVLSWDMSYFDNDRNIYLLKVLAVFTAGSICGLVILSYILTYLMKRYKDEIMAIIIGFITGSLGVVWPWKTSFYKMDEVGNVIYGMDKKPVLDHYERFLPEMNWDTVGAVAFVIVGIVIVLLLEYYGRNRKMPKALRINR